MPKKTADTPDRSIELLEMLLVFQLYSLGTPQYRIAKVVGRRRAWVDKLVESVPRGGRPDGSKEQG